MCGRAQCHLISAKSQNLLQQQHYLLRALVVIVIRRYTSLLWLLCVFTINFIGVSAQGLQDNRCYLENGGSAESFFVSEDVPVGTIIGDLSIHGDPRPIENGGNIALHLQETDSPVRIPPGTARLVLTKPLDKEGVSGPSSVYINVICDRLRTNDPGFVIPVTIRVTDVNDNAPIFINAPYVLNVSEVTVVGTRVLQGVRAQDADQHGPFSTVHYSVIQGPHSDYFVFENPLEGTLVLRKPLDYETLPTFSVGLRAQDHGNPPRSSDTTLHVNVIDADDQNPRFFDDRYMALLPDPPIKGAVLAIRPRDVGAYDQDVGINAPIFYTWNSVGADYQLFSIDRDSGKIRIKRDVVDTELMQPATLVIRATQVDNPDRYALATLTVRRSNDFTDIAGPVKFTQRHFNVGALESLPARSQITTLATNHPGDRNLKFYISDQKLLDTFSVGPNGELTLRRQLDYETEDSFVFKVFVTDGVTNDSALVNVTVLNVNEWEPRFRYPQYEFFIPEGHVKNGALVGRVQAADGDRGDQVTLALGGPYAGMFNINSNGEIYLKDLWPLNTSIVHLVAVATDSGVPARRVAVPVLVHFPPSAVMNGATNVGVAARASSGGFMVITAFATILGLLAIVIAVLVTYICKVKRPKGGKRKVGSTGFLQHEKLPPPHSMPGVGTGLLVSQMNHHNNSVGGGIAKNPVFGETVTPNHSTEVGLCSETNSETGIATARGGVPNNDIYTATVKSIMSRTPGSRSGICAGSNTITRIVSPKIHPAPSPPIISPQNDLGGPSSSSSDTNPNISSRTVEWPTTAMSNRVKKLSWDDDSQNKTEIDSIENANVENNNNNDTRSRINENTNLTVYF